MQILINHITRMHGAHICVAGIDLQTGRHVRPVLQQGGMPFDLLARYDGPFDMARIIDLGQPRPTPNAPHVEDYVFIASRARVERTVCPHEFWDVLRKCSAARLEEIFGSALQLVGKERYATALGQGCVSLGCLRIERPAELYISERSNRKPQIRVRFRDGRIQVDAAVTDLRLYLSDHATPNVQLVLSMAKWLRDSDRAILAVGLTRKFRRDDKSPFFHWLQVNNIHLHEDPLWQLD